VRESYAADPRNVNETINHDQLEPFFLSGTLFFCASDFIRCSALAGRLLAHGRAQGQAKRHPTGEARNGRIVAAMVTTANATPEIPHTRIGADTGDFGTNGTGRKMQDGTLAGGRTTTNFSRSCNSKQPFVEQIRRLPQDAHIRKKHYTNWLI
jgi:hypothetical protein